MTSPRKPQPNAIDLKGKTFGLLKGIAFAGETGDRLGWTPIGFVWTCAGRTHRGVQREARRHDELLPALKAAGR